MNWLSNLWFNYFWASLKGNGPEALVQTVVYGLVAWAVIPKFREFVNAHVRGVHERLKLQHEEHLRLVEDNHKAHLDLLKKQHAEVLKHVKPRPVVRPAKEKNVTKPTQSSRP